MAKIPEMWLVRGRKPVPWTIPFYVTRRDDFEVQLYPAVPLNVPQQRAINEFMANFGSVDPIGRWGIHPSLLPKVASQIDNGTDPEVVSTWGTPEDKQKKPLSISTGDAEQDEFLSDMLANVHMELPELVACWTLFKQQILHYLVNREKPVSFGFLKLHSSPYRRNWMFVMLSRFPRYWRAMTILNSSARKVELDTYFT
jgi:hypothetical protein